jgi:hypothetical protein
MVDCCHFSSYDSVDFEITTSWTHADVIVKSYGERTVLLDAYLG